MTIGLILIDIYGFEGCDRALRMRFLAWLLDSLFRLHIKKPNKPFERLAFYTSNTLTFIAIGSTLIEIYIIWTTRVRVVSAKFEYAYMYVWSSLVPPNDWLFVVVHVRHIRWLEMNSFPFGRLCRTKKIPWNELDLPTWSLEGPLSTNLSF